MAFFNKEDLIKWNDLATSLQDIIMRKITWDMLHPDLQAWLLDKEKRIIELERWRKTKVDPMLDDHENRLDILETQVTNLGNKLDDATSFSGGYSHVGASGTAPCDGFLLITSDNSGYGDKMICEIDGIRVAYRSGDGSYGGSSNTNCIPVKKGSSWSISGQSLSIMWFNIN